MNEGIRPKDRQILEHALAVLKLVKSKPRSRYDIGTALKCHSRTALRLLQAMREVGLVSSYNDGRVTWYVAAMTLTPRRVVRKEAA